MECQLTQAAVAPGRAGGCSTDTLARLHEQEGSTPVKGINPAQRPWERSAAGLIYPVHFIEEQLRFLSKSVHVRSLVKPWEWETGVLACQTWSTSQSSYTD